MREKRKITILKAGKDLGIKPKSIDHMENGRKFLSDDEISIFLEYYNFSRKIYEEMMTLTPIDKQTTNHFFLKKKIFK